jgi:Outer membrane protein beta-barrel domain
VVRQLISAQTIDRTMRLDASIGGASVPSCARQSDIGCVGDMKRATKILIAMSIASLLCNTLQAQDDSDKINSNIVGAVSLPLSPTSKTVHTSWGLAGGAGYNLSRHHSVIGEFMWTALYPSASALQPIRVASNDNSITGHSNLYTITGNYRYELQGTLIGAYFIAGGGWYYRTIGLSKPVTSGIDTPCTAAWMWWGFTCASGIVTPSQTIRAYDSSVFGGNVGFGLTIKVADPSYRMYIEPRYHYAPTQNVKTKVLEVMIGIRY